MPIVNQVDQMEQADDLDVRILEASRKQLIEEKKIIMNDDGSFSLTELGKEVAYKELQRYEFRPKMAIMIQMYILQMHDVSVN